MELSYKQLEKTLLAHFRISPDKEPTFRSRIKQLQRLNFPAGVNVGRGAKMIYGAEHLLMLVSAFELIGTGIPAQLACNLVTTHWATLAGGYALAAVASRGGGRAEPILAVIAVKTMHEIQFGRSGSVKPSGVAIFDVFAFEHMLRPPNYDRSKTHIVLSLDTLLREVLTAGRNQAGIVDAWSRSEVFHGWLPSGRVPGFYFKGRYPDQSNLEMRQHLHQRYGTDPDSMTPDGAEKAREFLERGYGYRSVKE